MGQQSSSSLADNTQLTRTLSRSNFSSPSHPIDHENILKLRSVPFHNCMGISQTPALFLENADYTLREILQQRYNTTKLLTEDDLLRMLEAIIYALAYLQSKGVVYKDLVPENIYYQADQRSFKLLPPELIDKSSFKMLREGSRFSMASPEMIVSLRSQSTWISNEMYHRSNIFTLGMIMLEAATLQSSNDCYEEGSLDILDRVVKDRLRMVEQFYPLFFKDILSNMLCYDYEERKSPQQMAVYLFEHTKNTIPAVKLKPDPVRMSTTGSKTFRSSVAGQQSPRINTMHASSVRPRLNMSMVEQPMQAQVAPQTAKARFQGGSFASPKGIRVVQPTHSPERSATIEQMVANISPAMTRSIILNPEVSTYATPIKEIVVMESSPRHQPIIANVPLEVIEERAELNEATQTAQGSIEAEVKASRINQQILGFSYLPSESADPTQQKTARLAKQMVDPRLRHTLPVRFHSHSPAHRSSQHTTEVRNTAHLRESSIDRKSRGSNMEIEQIDEEIEKVKRQLQQSKRLLASYQARGSAIRTARKQL